MLHSDQVLIVDYDSVWADLYIEERQVIQSVFEIDGVDIEHIGSTSVVGLSAKPIVDIMVGVESLQQVHERMTGLRNAGYQYSSEFEVPIPERRFFRKSRGRHGIVHLHCVETDTEFFVDHLEFRELLRSDPRFAERYVRLKRDLARRYRFNRAGYQEAKSGFIESALLRARETGVV